MKTNSNLAGSSTDWPQLKYFFEEWARSDWEIDEAVEDFFDHTGLLNHDQIFLLGAEVSRLPQTVKEQTSLVSLVRSFCSDISPALSHTFILELIDRMQSLPASLTGIDSFSEKFAEYV